MILKELLALLEEVKVGDKVIVNPKDWENTKDSNGKGTVVAVQHGEVHIRLDDVKRTVIAFDGEYKIDRSKDREDAEAWREKRAAALQGRKYHEPY